MSGLPQEALQALEALGISVPEGDPRKALAAIGKALSAARKALPKADPVRFEFRTEKDEETGQRVETDETVLRVQRGGRGAPLTVNRHAAELLVQHFEALRAFAETGEPQELAPQEPQEEGEEE